MSKKKTEHILFDRDRKVKTTLNFTKTNKETPAKKLPVPKGKNKNEN